MFNKYKTSSMKQIELRGTGLNETRRGGVHENRTRRKSVSWNWNKDGRTVDRKGGAKQTWTVEHHPHYALELSAVSRRARDSTVSSCIS